jgi:hypothetical protein
MKTLLISTLLVLFSAHDFYLSLTEINHNTENKSLEVSVKLFTDDLMLALENAGAPRMELGTESEPPAANEFIEAYLQSHLSLIVNGKSINYTYLGKEAELDATWCYLEVENVRKVKTLQVKNTIFLDEFESQTNMVNTFINGRKKSGLARNGSATLKFDF